jgi:PIN domain nuclease of toxin-antitoxin system
LKLLLDTYALLWLVAGDRRLARAALGMMADRANTTLVSMASFWEIAAKARAGRLQVDLDAVFAQAWTTNLQRLDIQQHHLAALRALPRFPDHRDPFDHLLIAQAITEGATLLTVDPHMPRYPVNCVPWGA